MIIRLKDKHEIKDNPMKNTPILIVITTLLLMSIIQIIGNHYQLKLNQDILNRLNCLEQGMIYVGDNFCADNIK